MISSRPSLLVPPTRRTSELPASLIHVDILCNHMMFPIVLTDESYEFSERESFLMIA